MDAETVLPSEWKAVEIGGGLILTAAVALRLAGVAPLSAAATGMAFLTAIIVILFGAKALAKVSHLGFGTSPATGVTSHFP